MSTIDRIYMTEALKEAREALKAGEVPVGAVVVRQQRLIGRAHHQTHALKDPTAHAPMIAITQAAAAVGNRWLKPAVAYVTAKPCAMCAGAMALAGVERVVYGTPDQPAARPPRMTGRILQQDCAALLAAYRRQRRQRKRLVVTSSTGLERCESG